MGRLYRGANIGWAEKSLKKNAYLLYYICVLFRLRKHMFNAHGKNLTTTERCRYCGQVVTQLKDHIHNEHKDPELGRFTCHLCEYKCTFSKGITFVNHLRIIHGFKAEEEVGGGEEEEEEGFILKEEPETPLDASALVETVYHEEDEGTGPDRFHDEDSQGYVTVQTVREEELDQYERRLPDDVQDAWHEEAEEPSSSRKDKAPEESVSSSGGRSQEGSSREESSSESSSLDDSSGSSSSSASSSEDEEEDQEDSEEERENYYMKTKKECGDDGKEEPGGSEQRVGALGAPPPDACDRGDCAVRRALDQANAALEGAVASLKAVRGGGLVGDDFRCPVSDALDNVNAALEASLTDLKVRDL